MCLDATQQKLRTLNSDATTPSASVLSLIVMNASLGWYDALSFGPGRAEIVNNEGFFKRAFVLAGKQKVDDFLSFERS